MIRVLIVDDHPIFRSGLSLSLGESPDLQICGEADTAAAALTLARDLRPDVVLLDLSLPGGGLNVLPDLVALDGVNVAVLTASEACDDVMAAINTGARGYILKGIGGAPLIDAVRSIAAGEGYITPTLAARILTEIRVEERLSPQRSASLDLLTPREAEVLNMVAAGHSNKEIARLGDMQEKTVKHHMTRILHKLGARNRTEAALLLRDGTRSDQSRI
ncbi:two component LuxR family transcriptional regulator (plasmid) [Ketogulonicigenium vulgare Y25]|uniref:Putative CitB, response regulator containing a CheY-like protein receiver domain protein n=1 Tax=Ketogulonicigenium vulgare (strain WSH-001) TaxID=759362 RepID=F9YBQ6_KETVW|nr:response regulator transcription factor [Ketogulonicigenium vulgare]ADO44371.1 two component LuxR family transcriptional regulator [Ketogulonicigenium vulgare Y25]AEM42808.1 putative CitB, response regulator containing a CheY-like protein receiver domain protein [Ketogulonicigenium vulgare WSH-001]ALJ82760.1 two-component system response regulator [Ketogulonicigenium vulgare]